MSDTRRRRYSRKRTGKRIELTKRDISIFKLLQRYRYLRSTFIYAFVGGKQKTRFKERLGDLFHEGYLNRPKQQWQCINARYSPAIYELDRRAEDVLKELGEQAENISRLVIRGRMGRLNRQFAHSIMICDTLASIELGVNADPTVRFVSWQEILSRAPNTTRVARNPFSFPVSIQHTYKGAERTHRTKFGLIPDGLFGLEYKGKGFRFFALEAERTNRVYCSNLNQTSFLKKVLAYREITATKTYQSHLNLPNLIVMVVTPTQARIDTMTKVIDELTGGRGNKQFIFRPIPVLGGAFNAPTPEPTLYTDPWARVGHSDFYISQP